MHIAIVTCVFPPEPVVSSQTSAQIAEALSKNGHKVTVITSFPNRPGGNLYPGYSRRLFKWEGYSNGFNLLRCFTTLSPQSTMASRFIENICFGIMAGIAVLFIRRPDAVYCNAWPIFATGIVRLASYLRGVPMVLSVQDIYPESLLTQERIKKDNRVTRWMMAIDKVVAESCKAVIVVSESFAHIYQSMREVDREKVHFIPNWINDDLITPDNTGAQVFRSSQSIPADAFLTVYGGNIGVASGIETLLESCTYLKECSDIYTIIAGEGGCLSDCRTVVMKTHCNQLQFYTPWPKEMTSAVLSAADLLILPTKGAQSLVSLPSKLIAYMLAGRPIIALALPQSDLARLVNQAKCGWVVEPDQPKLLAEKIKEVYSLDPKERMFRGSSGREFALRNMISKVCLPRVIALLEEAGT